MPNCQRCACMACAGSAPAPPPPVAPPAPPGEISVAQQILDVDVTVAGFVEMYVNSTLVDDAVSAVANLTRVPLSSVSVRVIAASARLVFSVRTGATVGTADAADRQSTLTTSFHDAASARRILGAPVISDPRIVQRLDYIVVNAPPPFPAFRLAISTRFWRWR